MSYTMLPQYLDSYGLPGSISKNSPLNMGDACADYFTILACTDMVDDKVDLFWSPENTPRRHPDTSQWWGQPHVESRDQFLPILCYAVMRKVQSSFIRKLFISHLKRCFLFAWNTKTEAIPGSFNFPDITFLEVIGLWLRIYKPFGYKILLPICDMETLVNAIIWKYWPQDNITRNFMLVAAAHKTDPSVISNIAYKLSDFNDLLSRWEANTIATGEYPTAPLIKGILCL